MQDAQQWQVLGYWLAVYYDNTIVQPSPVLNNKETDSDTSQKSFLFYI